MADLPIIFSAPMVRALLDGRKTMTRRLAMQTRKTHPSNTSHDTYQLPSPWLKVKPGDRLWVRESLSIGEGEIDYEADGALCNDISGPHMAAAAALHDRRRYDDDRRGGRGVPSIHMPRWASRLTLTVTAVKVERLQEISEEDAKAEGVESVPNNFGNGAAYRDYLGRPDDTAEWFKSPVDSFRSLWLSLHGDESWDANPEVCALSFTVEKRNIDRKEPVA